MKAENSIYHIGEIAIQEMVGQRPMAEIMAKHMSNSIPDVAVGFIESQHMFVVSSKDNKENIWVSAIFGLPGFAKVVDKENVGFSREKTLSSFNDIFYKNVIKNDSVGGLFIELITRRRYRINGHITATEDHIDLKVKEAYVNCPKYIQRREPSLLKDRLENNKTSRGHGLTSSQLEQIKKSDTVFVGTGDTANKLDASHRGGNPGFISVLENGKLKIPDYQGNNVFNTLGNIKVNPKAGLLFIDFEENITLQLTGEAELLFDQELDIDTQTTTGTGRYWLFKTLSWIQTNGNASLNWQFIDSSPFNP